MIPQLVTSIGAMSFSKARFRNEKHSISSMWTSSMNRTPGTISAFPSSRHSATFVSICSLTSAHISLVSPVKRARKPCVLHFITKIIKFSERSSTIVTLTFPSFCGFSSCRSSLALLPHRQQKLPLTIAQKDHLCSIIRKYTIKHQCFHIHCNTRANKLVICIWLSYVFNLFFMPTH